MSRINSFGCLETLKVDNKEYLYYCLIKAEKNGLPGISRLPFSMKVLLENLLRFEDGCSVTKKDIQNIARWLVNQGRINAEIAYRPARVLMQDFTGVPAIVDLAAMRDAMVRLGGNPDKINPVIPVDLVIDHSVIVDEFGHSRAFQHNVKLEYQRNSERYRFLKWGQQAFKNFRVVPPGTGICHQINLEYLAQTIRIQYENNGLMTVYPDTCIGTDSHTTMINGLGVLGWGVGGIEAEAAMLGQPITMLVPEVIGVRLTGSLKEGVTTTDLVLSVTQMLRKKGVVGKFVEFFGPGIQHMTVADRATIGNMGPEYGATCGFFPIDEETIRYLNMTGRDNHSVRLVEAYARSQGMWCYDGIEDPIFTDILEFNIGEVVPSMAGPKRPEARVPLEKIKSSFYTALRKEYNKDSQNTRYYIEGKNCALGHGDVVIAAITSCTNTSNPGMLIAAGLLAKNAVSRGLKVKPWVKTSFAPGSKVAHAYLIKAGLQKYLDALGFNVVGFGCTTCIGNSGPLFSDISKTIQENGLIAAAVLSGNRNFEGRISPDVQANYLASPSLVVVYALVGSVCKNLITEPLGIGEDDIPVYLQDIWPDPQDVRKYIDKYVTRELFKSKYSDLFIGDDNWQAIEVSLGKTYNWDSCSTYVRHPPYFQNISKEPGALGDIEKARILGLFGDKITTDHISPAGSIIEESPAGCYLMGQGIKLVDFNQYGTRRGNHEVMMRGTFSNIRLRNYVLGENGREGGYTIHYPTGSEESIYDAAMHYLNEKVPLVIFAGREYGNGSSRDWAAKGTNLLGVRAIIAQSFERIHRSNLIGMGILPFIFDSEVSWQSLGLKGNETVSIFGINALRPRQETIARICFADRSTIKIRLIYQVDTLNELEYLHHGGILHYVLRSLA